MLTVRNLTFGYHHGERQLSDVNLDIGLGRTVLLGPNGAGKTTLLRILAGAYRFSGSIDLDGMDVPPRRRTRAYRTAVGWLPQEVNPFPGLTVREHVAYVGWLKGMSRSRAWVAALDALHMVGLAERANERANRLSGGQTRRLGIASTLVHEAKYVLLDEPTAGLDPRERDRLAEILAPLERSRSLLVSTHDTESIIDKDSKVVVLVEGTIRFDGTFDSFIANQAEASETQQVRNAYAAFVPEN